MLSRSFKTAMATCGHQELREVEAFEIQTTEVLKGLPDTSNLIKRQLGYDVVRLQAETTCEATKQDLQEYHDRLVKRHLGLIFKARLLLSKAGRLVKKYHAKSESQRKRKQMYQEG